jgi:hypothetical protein
MEYKEEKTKARLQSPKRHVSFIEDRWWVTSRKFVISRMELVFSVSLDKAVNFREELNLIRIPDWWWFEWGDQWLTYHPVPCDIQATAERTTFWAVLEAVDCEIETFIFSHHDGVTSPFPLPILSSVFDTLDPLAAHSKHVFQCWYDRSI